MKRDNYKTKVVFRMIMHDVIAIFIPDKPDPEQKWCESYMHVGQHSDCDPIWIDEGEIPTIDECANLINELQDLGYDLEFVKGKGEQ